ncbi:MAG: hypothetical protein U1E05_01445 [Patescibacteria group bacterium]|nr:hypothetical protein [Patescibacteria group bacterium]
MPRLAATLGSLLAYFAIGTLVAQACLAAMIVWKWDLNRDRMIQILALAQGVDLFAMREGALVREEKLAEQVSFDEIRATRAMKFRNLELREQALASAVAQLQLQQQTFTEDRNRFNQVRDTFNNELTTMREGALAQGLDEVRRILETVKPQQAKLQLAEMLTNNEIDTVVRLLAGMPDQKRSKIIGEFKTPEDELKIAEVLKRILEGTPDAELADATQGQL